MRFWQQVTFWELILSSGILSAHRSISVFPLSTCSDRHSQALLSSVAGPSIPYPNLSSPGCGDRAPGGYLFCQCRPETDFAAKSIRASHRSIPQLITTPPLNSSYCGSTAARAAIYIFPQPRYAGLHYFWKKLYYGHAAPLLHQPVVSLDSASNGQ